MGMGYNLALKSYPPFMYIEFEKEMPGFLMVLCYGAYNARGLIGPEMGGVAIVCDHPDDRFTIATKDFPYSPAERRECADRLGKAESAKALLLQALEDGFDFRNDPEIIRQQLERMK